MLTLLPILIALLQGPPPSTVGEDILLRFNAVAEKANQVRADRGISAAIEVYEEALTDPANQGYGQLHLRLGQLYKRTDQFAAAAYHFRKCSADVRVDSVDRDIICEHGFKKVTAPLHIDDLPDSAKAILIYPEQFAGPLRSGQRLPKGQLTIVVEAPGRTPRESTVTLMGDQRWRAVLGMTKRSGPLVSDEFLKKTDLARPTTNIEVSQPIRWPAYTVGSIGAALLATGIYLGVDNRTFLSNTRLRYDANRCGSDSCGGDFDRAAQTANTADGLWISGAVLAATSIGLYFLFDGGDGGEE